MCLSASLIASPLGGLLSLLLILWARALGPTQPASAMDANMCVAVSQPKRLCSMSTVSQAQPARAMNRDAVIEPSDSQVPIAGSPALRARLTGLGRMRQFSWKRSRLGECENF